ncbi:hypothetical protein NQZ68_008028 [Dissostichus eleginoides]|nr:hypothetical protein NQZ68_008028 [Dissostichus eleginoides]
MNLQSCEIVKERGTGERLACGMFPLDFPSETEKLETQALAELLGPGLQTPAPNDRLPLLLFV